MTQPNLTVLIPPIKPPHTRADAQADMIACGIKPRERILHQPIPARYLRFGADHGEIVDRRTAK